ncbi:MAG: hypothetical protein WC602_05340 [archaeon]
MKTVFVLVLVILLASVIIASGCVQNGLQNKAAGNSDKNTLNANSEVGPGSIPTLPDANDDKTPTVPPF